MIRDVLLIFAWLIGVPLGLFVIAFLVALGDCTYAYLFPSPLPAILDDSV
jgi:hypothetical protein